MRSESSSSNLKQINPQNSESITRLRFWLCASLLLSFICSVVSSNTSYAQAVPESRAQLSLSFAPVVRSAAPAVVNVYANRLVRERRFSPFQDDPFFRRFFGERGFSDGRGLGVPRKRVQSSLGSGVIVSSDGIIVTNNHVIENADEIKVALADRREYPAQVLLKDERTDLAVLQILEAESQFRYLEFGDSDGLEVGDLVLAIGNPFGVGQTVTSGIVSALARTRVGVADYQFFIQTDAAINPGNSGGALVDMAGRLIGVNTAIFSRSGGSNGIGFAVPASMVKLVVNSAKTGTRVRRPWFGAKLQAVTAEIAETLGMIRPVGVIVAEIHPNGPAAYAGLKVGDILVKVEGDEIVDPQSFYYRFSTKGIGGKSEVEGLRDGRPIKHFVERQSALEDPPRNERQLGGRSPFSGLTVANLSPALSEELDLDFLKTGVIVLEMEQRSLARQVGFKVGDIIKEVNGTEIDSVFDLDRVSSKGFKRWDLVIERGNRIIRTRL